LFISKIQLSKEFIAVREVGEEVLARLVLEVSDDFDYYYRVSYGLVDCFDVPESPLGYPGVNSVASCVYLKTRYGVCCIAHVRLYDVNALALHSLAHACEVFGIDGLVLTMGDRPRVGTVVHDLCTEKAIELLRKTGYRVKLGALISLRYSLEDILSRLSGTMADFFFVLRLGWETMDDYVGVYRESRRLGKELYPYVLVATESNRKILSRINQPYILASELPDYLRELHGIVDGIVLSIPCERNINTILRIAREYIK